MRFDREYFDAGLYRMGTACEKWDVCRREHGVDQLPMWVADMDFQSPPAVTEALLRRAAHPTYGYTELTEAQHLALTSFWQRRHGLKVTKAEVSWLPCVVTGLKTAIRAVTRPGDGIIIQSPVYGPFRMSVEVTGRTLMDAPLQVDSEGRYHMDLEAVERQCRAGARLMLLCNPHNPVSRPWSREELRALLEVLNRYQVPLASDEIHADFVYAPNRFVPVLTLQKERVLSLCAASKTFNLAGLQTASCLCFDEKLREAFRHALDEGGVVSGNIFGMEATRAAYDEGDAWLDGLLDYLDGNRAELKRQVEEQLPKAVLTPLEATYLGWLNLRAYGFTCEELARRCEQAGVIFTGGTFFGKEAGEGHLRINVGCPRANIVEAVERLRRALEA